MAVTNTDTLSHTDWNGLFQKLEFKLDKLFSGCSFTFPMDKGFGQSVLPSIVGFNGFMGTIFYMVSGSVFFGSLTWPTYDAQALEAEMVIDRTRPVAEGNYVGQYKVAELIFEGISSFEMGYDPEKFRFFRVHNLSQNTFTLTLPQGTVTVPRFGVKSFRIHEGEIIQPWKYCWEMVAGDYWFWDFADASMRACFVAAPARILDWLYVLDFERLGGFEKTRPFGFRSNLPTAQTQGDYSSLFGNINTASTKMGELRYYKGALVYGGTQFQFNGFDSFVDDCDAVGIVATQSGFGFFLEGEGLIQQLSTNLLGAWSQDLPYMIPNEIEMDWSPVVTSDTGDRVLIDRPGPAKKATLLQTVQEFEDSVRDDGYTIESKGMDERGFYWVVKLSEDFDQGPETPIASGYDFDGSGWVYREEIRFKDAGFPTQYDSSLWIYPRRGVAKYGGPEPVVGVDGITAELPKGGEEQVRFLGPAEVVLEPNPILRGINDDLFQEYFLNNVPFFPATQRVSVPILKEHFNRIESAVDSIYGCLPLQLTDIYAVNPTGNSITGAPINLGSFDPKFYFSHPSGHHAYFVSSEGVPVRDESEWADQTTLRQANNAGKTASATYTLAAENTSPTSTALPDGRTRWTWETTYTIENLSFGTGEGFKTSIDFDFYDRQLDYLDARDLATVSESKGFPFLHYRTGTPVALEVLESEGLREIFSGGSGTETGEYTGTFPGFFLPSDSPRGITVDRRFLRHIPNREYFFLSRPQTFGAFFPYREVLQSQRVQDVVFSELKGGVTLLLISQNTHDSLLRYQGERFGLYAMEITKTSHFVDNSKAVAIRVPYSYLPNRANEHIPPLGTITNDSEKDFEISTVHPLFAGDAMEGRQVIVFKPDFYVPC